MIIISGTTRSGTTWLAELLSEYYKYRILFEPFYSTRKYIFGKELTRKYIPEKAADPIAKKMMDILFFKHYRMPKLDQANFIMKPKGRILKFITANLSLDWIAENYPNIPIIYIIRHPCAVVSSRLKMGFHSDLSVFLNQQTLVDDYLENMKDSIGTPISEAENEAYQWAIENLIPITNYKNKRWLITSYEGLVMNLNEELKRMTHYIDDQQGFDINKVHNITSLMGDQSEGKVSKRKRLEVWNKRLSQKQITDIFKVVNKFSLDYIYDRGPFCKLDYI